jgi:hypothetical protein
MSDSKSEYNALWDWVMENMPRISPAMASVLLSTLFW